MLKIWKQFGIQVLTIDIAIGFLFAGASAYATFRSAWTVLESVAHR